MSGMTMIIRLARDYPGERYPDVRLLQLGGDTIYRSDVEACQRVYRNAVVAAGLGMSEAGRVAEMFIPPGTTLDHDVVPVGYDVPCVRVVLRSDDGAEAAPGEPGEIVVHSAYLAQGYWQRPELTAERFRPDPLGRIRACLLHRGCRSARIRRHPAASGPQGLQVKIRGHQVPTNEVESGLLECAGVREVCVVATRLPDGNQELVAYLALESGCRIAAEELGAELRARCRSTWFHTALSF